MDIYLKGVGINPILDWVDERGDIPFYYYHFYLERGVYVASYEGIHIFDDFKRHIDYFNRKGIEHDWEELEYNGWEILHTRVCGGVWYCKKEGMRNIIYITN